MHIASTRETAFNPLARSPAKMKRPFLGEGSFGILPG